MIRVFAGCAANNEDLESQAVFEWSVRKHESEQVEITWMQLSRDPTSPWHGWRTEYWATPFSGFRWAVPEVAGFEGKAIYSDSDVIFMADIAELWHQKFEPSKIVMAKGGGPTSWRLCVSMWDCAAAKGRLPKLEVLKDNPYSHAEMCGLVARGNWLQKFKGNWNCLDGENLALDDPRLKALHYTSIASQPQLRHALPRLEREGGRHWYDGKIIPHPRVDIVQLFDRMLEEAIAHGYSPENYRKEPYGGFEKASLRNYKTELRTA